MNRLPPFNIATRALAAVNKLGLPRAPGKAGVRQYVRRRSSADVKLRDAMEFWGLWYQVKVDGVTVGAFEDLFVRYTADQTPDKAAAAAVQELAPRNENARTSR